MHSDDVEGIVDEQLAAMPSARALWLREYLVVPRREQRITRSCRLQASDTWVVAVRGAEVLGLSRRPHLDDYQWIVLERDAEDLGYDDQWYETLDDALVGAGWCD